MDDDKTSLKEVVAAYLRKHPDFLDQFPDILGNFTSITIVV